MSFREPAFPMIGGSGLPRLMVISDVIYSSAGATTFSATGVAETGSPDYSSIGAGMRIESVAVSGTLLEPAHAKILSIGAGTITVDAWHPGTPTNGQQFKVNGFVIDLPRCGEKKLHERRTPIQILQKLLGARKDSEFQGWEYTCNLDYSKYVPGDILADLGPAFSLKATDQMVLIPRVDDYGLQYNVIWSQETIDLAMAGQLMGHEGLVLKFEAKEPVASWPIITGYGFGYGMDYGDQL